MGETGGDCEGRKNGGVGGGIIGLLPGMSDPDSKLHDLWEEDTTKLKHDTYKVPWPVLYAYASLF